MYKASFFQLHDNGKSTILDMMLTASKIFQPWMDTLKRHLSWLTTSIHLHLEQDMQDEERLNKPCMLNTRHFLTTQGLDIRQPIENLIPALQELADGKQGCSEAACNKAKAIVEEWKHYCDVVYAHNASHVNTLSLFRDQAFEHDMAQVTVDTLFTNSWWRRVPHDCARRSGFQFVQFHPFGTNNKRKPWEMGLLGERQEPSSKRQRVEQKQEQKVSTQDKAGSWAEAFGRLVHNGQLAAQTYVLNQVAHELTVLNRNMNKFVEEVPTAGSFIQQYLSSSSETVPETKQEQLWLPPSYGYLQDLMDAHVDYCLAVQMITFAHDHERWMKMCEYPLLHLSRAFPQERLLQDTLQAHADIQRALVKNNLQVMQEEFDKGLYRIKLETAIVARQNKTMTWLEHTADRAVSLHGQSLQQGMNIPPPTERITQQWHAYLAAEKKQVEAVFEERQQPKFAFMIQGWQRHSALLKQFDEAKYRLLLKWKPYNLDSDWQALIASSFRVWFKPIQASPAGKKQQNIDCQDWMQQITQMLPATRQVDTALAQRHWQQPRELSDCIQGICQQATKFLLDSVTQKTLSWDEWMSWIKQTTFMVSWYETMRVFLAQANPSQPDTSLPNDSATNPSPPQTLSSPIVVVT